MHNCTRMVGLKVVSRFASMLLLAGPGLFAQLPSAVSLLPAGFTLKGEQNLGGTLLIDAVKPNENFPKPHKDQGIELRIAWQRNPMANMILDMAAKTPEEPAAQLPGSLSREEPCGTRRHRDGVLTCRKVITPWAGSGKGPELMTWRLGWTGKGQDGLVTITVNRFHGAKETAVAWIDNLIPKVTQGK